MTKLLIKFENEETIIDSSMIENLIDNRFEIDFKGRLKVMFENAGEKIIAVNAMNGGGHNIANQVKGKEPEIFLQWQYKKSKNVARIVVYKKIDKEDPRDYNIAYGLEVNGEIAVWFATENPYLSDKAQADELKKIELYKEIVFRINNF